MAYLCFKMLDNGYGRYYGITSIQNCIGSYMVCTQFLTSQSRLSFRNETQMKLNCYYCVFLF
jgi:hypothetical protein